MESVFGIQLQRTSYRGTWKSADARSPRARAQCAPPRCNCRAVLFLFQHCLQPAFRAYLQQANRMHQVVIMLTRLRLSLTLQNNYTMFTTSITRANCLLHGTNCPFPADFSPPMCKFALICQFGSALWEHFPVIVFQSEHPKCHAAQLNQQIYNACPANAKKKGAALPLRLSSRHNALRQ